MKIMVVGPGAVGLLWACRLARAGAAVELLDHRPDRARQLNQQGLTLVDDQGEHTLHLPVSADPARLSGMDLALVCVKAYDTAGVAATLAQHLPPNGHALTLQNGAGNLETLAQALGPQRVLGGTTSEGATLLGPGKVRHAGQGQTHLGPMQGSPGPLEAELAHIFNQAGFNTQVSPRAQDLIWSKLIINVGINALTALLEVPNGRLLELPDARQLMARAVAEALAVGDALNVNFIHADMPAAVETVARNTAGNISSMLQDVHAGRPTEVDFINGAICRFAQQAGLTAPVNQTLTSLVKARQQAD